VGLGDTARQIYCGTNSVQGCGGWEDKLRVGRVEGWGGGGMVEV
jgi:hypothetical protein